MFVASGLSADAPPVKAAGMRPPVADVDKSPRRAEITTLFRGNQMRAVFVQLQCMPGKTYEVADTLFEREVASELYSTSGEYDLLMKVYVKDGEDIGRIVNEHIADIPGIVRTLTTLTFKAF